ncbi:MAG: DUF362 domain-containing protein [bacterium]
MKKMLRAVRHFLHGSFAWLGIGSVLWLILRSGTKPDRLRYPCQQAAASTGAFWLSAFALPGILRGLRACGVRLPEAKLGRPIRLILVAGTAALVAVLVGERLFTPHFGPPPSPTGAHLPVWVSDRPLPSRVFVVDSIPVPDSNSIYHEGIDSLFALLAANGTCLYRSPRQLPWCDTAGLIGRDDVVLIKVNAEWPERGMTSTDVIKGLISRIVEHPDTFTGEVQLVENGQWRHSWAYPLNNAERRSQTMQSVVDTFAARGFRVGAYNWTAIGYGSNNRWVGEFGSGDTLSGYVREDSTGMTYAKFTTGYGTRVSTRLGVWNGAAYEPDRLKFINLPVLKSHSLMGVTGAVKHYIGFLSYAAIGSGTMHSRAMAQGLLGVNFGKARFPDLNIIDATWVSAEITTGPNAPYDRCTRLNTLVASRDPVAADWYAGKHVLRPASWWNGHPWLRDYGRMDPDNLNNENPGSGRSYSDSTPCSGFPYNAFHQMLASSRDEMLRYGRQVTMDSAEMTIHRFRFSPVAIRGRSGTPPPAPALAITPSLAGGRVTVRFRLAAAGPVRLVVSSIDGRRVAETRRETLVAGEQALVLDRPAVAGEYLLTVETAAGPLSGRFIVPSR